MNPAQHTNQGTLMNTAIQQSVAGLATRRTTTRDATRVTRRIAALLALGTLASLLGGCMTTTPMYDKQFGDAVRTVRAMQTLNPDAGNNTTDPGVGVDGRSATAAMDNFNRAYRTPQTDTNAFQVGVGTSSGR